MGQATCSEHSGKRNRDATRDDTGGTGLKPERPARRSGVLRRGVSETLSTGKGHGPDTSLTPARTQRASCGGGWLQSLPLRGTAAGGRERSPWNGGTEAVSAPGSEGAHCDRAVRGPPSGTPAWGLRGEEEPAPLQSGVKAPLPCRGTSAPAPDGKRARQAPGGPLWTQSTWARRRAVESETGNHERFGFCSK